MRLSRPDLGALMLLSACLLLWMTWALPGVLALTADFEIRPLRTAVLLTYDGIAAATLRSAVIVAIVLPIMIVTATLLAALLLSSMRTARNRSCFAMLLLAPALAGPVTFAFLWRHMIPGIDHGAGLGSNLAAILPWSLGQACPLMTGFLVLSFNNRMRREELYGVATHLPAFRVALLSLLSHQKWLIAGFTFVLGSLLFNERIIMELALRPSQGASNELLSHALERIHRLISLAIDPVVATQISFAYAVVAAVVATAVIAVVTMVILRTLSWLVRHSARSRTAYAPLTIAGISLFVVVLWVPALMALPTLRDPMSALASLQAHTWATSLCAFAVLVAGIATGAASFQRWAADKRPTAAEVGIVLFLTVPPSAIGLGWMYFAGHLADSGHMAFRAAWMFAATASYFPLGFLLSSLVHRYVDPRSFRYSKRAGISAARFESIAFVRAFPASLVALFTVFALNIWSDWGASAAFAGAINIFAELLVVAASGRAENASAAASLSWIAILLGSAAALLVARSSLKSSG